MDENELTGYVRQIMAVCRGQTDPEESVRRLLDDVVDRAVLMRCASCRAKSVRADCGNATSRGKMP